MTDYREATLSDHPDLQPPPPTVSMRCSCGWDGDGLIIQTAPGCIASIQGPAEPPTVVVRCGKCGKDHDPEDAEASVTFVEDEEPPKMRTANEAQAQAERKISEAAQILHHYHRHRFIARVGACGDAAAEIHSACELLAEAGAALAVAYLAEREARK